MSLGGSWTAGDKEVKQNIPIDMLKLRYFQSNGPKQSSNFLEAYPIRGKPKSKQRFEQLAVPIDACPIKGRPNQQVYPIPSLTLKVCSSLALAKPTDRTTEKITMAT